MKRGNKSVIFINFTFDRTLGFYFLQIYIPLTIIVMSSWVSFWLVKTNQVQTKFCSSLMLKGHLNLCFEGITPLINYCCYRAKRFLPGPVLEPLARWPWSPSGLGGKLNLR